MTKEQIKEFTLKTTQENHSGLILVLFDMQKIYVTDGLEAYDRGDIEEYVRQINQARKVLNELLGCLDAGDPLARRVIAVMRFIYRKLTDSTVRRKPDDLDRCQDMMDNLRVGFVRLQEIDDEGPVMKNTHQVYAGLTYGKGKLNESIQGVDYAKRGYKA